MSKRTDTIKSLFAAPQSSPLSADNASGALPRVSSGTVRSLKDSFSEGKTRSFAKESRPEL